MNAIRVLLVVTTTFSTLCEAESRRAINGHSNRRQRLDTKSMVMYGTLGTMALGLASLPVILPSYELTTSSRKDEGDEQEKGGALSRVFDMAQSWGRALGLNQCAEMAICDAHANFRSYGIVALPVILLFPG